jgi:hypothetical protein
MTLKTKTAAFFLFTLLIIITSCGGDDEPKTNPESNTYIAAANCGPDAPKYTGKIQNIITQNCGSEGCHSTKTKSKNIVMDTYEGAKKDFLNGKSLCSINYDCDPMPIGGDKLPKADLDLLACWVKGGALL